AEDGIRDRNVTGVQTCALPICAAIFKRIATGRRARTPPLGRQSSLYTAAAFLLIGGPPNAPRIVALITAFSRSSTSLRSRPGRRSEERRVGKDWRTL